MDELQITQESFDAIASEQSVVGIDAKKTHILILHMLMEMNERLERIEKQMQKTDAE